MGYTHVTILLFQSLEKPTSKNGEALAGWSERAIREEQRKEKKDTAESPTSQNRAVFVFLTLSPHSSRLRP